jgi:hypothetical protein
MIDGHRPKLKRKKKDMSKSETNNNQIKLHSTLCRVTGTGQGRAMQLGLEQADKLRMNFHLQRRLCMLQVAEVVGECRKIVASDSHKSS